LMLRSGLCRMLVAGAYSYLPLGLRVLNNIENIVRQEMNAVSASELLLPALQPLELWQKSGRDKELGEVMIRFVDRRGRNLCLGPTHEEVITDLAKNHIFSYRQLPLVLYQIQTKFRDEIRPRFGLVRACEFIMKDAYSFDRDSAGLDKNYQAMLAAYQKIFLRCGLKVSVIEADSGVMGGKVSHEFVVPVEGSEDLEIGHVFKLETKYSSLLGANFLDTDGKEKPIMMGCYGIGVSRLIAAIIEQNHDAAGIIWPDEISPFKVLVLPLDVTDAKIMDSASEVYARLQSKNIETLLDDRDERAGVKFKDADLLGISLQLIIGKEFLKNGNLELKLRHSGEKIIKEKESMIQEIARICHG
jgi:prolyl-tRNA synthetase